MELHDFVGAQNAIVQIEWGKQKIEFSTDVLETYWDGVLVTPYIYQEKPLELTIPADGNVICNIFGDDPFNGKRISFRNLELSTEHVKGAVYYYLKASGYNKQSNLEERRDKDRIDLHVRGRMSDKSSDTTYEIHLHDISDNGLSFYVSNDFNPKTDHLLVEFRDEVNKREFELKLECRIVRADYGVGSKMYGCAIVKFSQDFLVYSCLKRLRSKVPVH